MKTIILTLITVLIMGNISAQQENTFSYRIGNFELVLLSEGQSQGNPNIIIGATPEMLQETMPDGTYATAVNAYLLKTPGKNILVDTGFGKNLLANLQTVGVTPEDIHTVIITHMHGDHIGGMLKEGEIVFPNAKVQIGKKEYAYWTSVEEMNKQPENRKGNFLNAQNVLKLYADKLEIVELSDLEHKQGDGIFFIKAYGHTPGHTACLIQSGNEKFLIWADLTHVMALQMPYPEISVTYDVDPQQARESREAILEYVAKHHIPVAGMHVSYPGIGKVETADKGYTFTPAQ